LVRGFARQIGNELGYFVSICLALPVIIIIIAANRGGGDDGKSHDRGGATETPADEPVHACPSGSIDRPPAPPRKAVGDAR